MSDDKALKRFNGESEDPGTDLKRWKAWAAAKLATLKDIKPIQKGPWLFTLLDGSAYEAVEHFSLEDIAIEDGDRKVWEALHSRFPEKEPLDQMGEVLGEVFTMQWLPLSILLSDVQGQWVKSTSTHRRIGGEH